METEDMLNYTNLTINPLANILNNQIPSRFGTVFGAIIAHILSIFGLFGHVIIFMVIICSAHLRKNPINLVIISLQVNDCLNICFNQFQVGLSYTFQGWLDESNKMCELLVYTSIMSTGCLTWHHAFISIHRFLVVVHRQNRSFMGMKPKVYIILVVVISRLIPIFVCIPMFIHGEMIIHSPNASRCLLAPYISIVQSILILIFNMFIPCSIVLFCFIRIYQCVNSATEQNSFSKIIKSGNLDKTTTPYGSTNSRMKASNQPNSSLLNPDQIIDNRYSLAEAIPEIIMKMQPSKNQRISFRKMKREVEISKMFGVIFLLFLAGFFPYTIIRFFDTLTPNNLHPDVYLILTLVLIVSISISPVIYGMMNPPIRKEFIIFLRGRDSDRKETIKMSMRHSSPNIRNHLKKIPSCESKSAMESRRHLSLI